ncbi:MAG TPA: polymer-forming cytoskeletal protein [Pyrinomonadaceae bacterium]|nr:polymer-forming cytoskeletal protein [Pyrinomonadaceae bacterium]
MKSCTLAGASAVIGIVNELSLQSPLCSSITRILWKAGVALSALLLALVAAHARVVSDSSDQGDKAPLVVEGVSECDVFGIGRSVRVVGTVKHGAISFGGDVIVEGRVEGDVAAIGGSVIQREGSHIGGDVLVIGGAYHHGKTAPGRNPASMTLMYAGYEDELRRMMRDPTTILTPEWSLAYAGLRLLAVLFWFIASLALTAVSPGAVSRAMARLRLTNLRIAVIGFLGAVVMAFGIPVSLRFLPPAISVLVVIMAMLLLLMAYLFGRVVIHAATGRWLQRLLLAEGKRSESVALLLGVGFWTVILSLPYIWPLVVAGLLVTSLGLTLTARYRIGWKRAPVI